MLSATCKGTFFPVILGIFLFFCHGTANAWSLVCESIDGQSRYCRADTRGGVQLVRQLSKSGCYEGQTWGYDRRGVWVTAGCRGVFELGGMYAYPHEDRYVDERNH
ncbi:MAG: DUF3011 domain-containing protein, partial [Desulfobulbus sp.]|nr:DUF3011 domain-containing protein [Desulfobulbus sp.]